LIVQMKTDVLLVGACSLLLTQMRYEHRNRFGDTTPGDAHAQPDRCA
jgi:hypothetical protein